MVENPYSSPSKPCFFPFLAVVFSSDRRTLELWKFKPVAAAPSAPLSYEAGAKGAELQQMSTVKTGISAEKAVKLELKPGKVVKNGDFSWKSLGEAVKIADFSWKYG